MAIAAKDTVRNEALAVMRILPIALVAAAFALAGCGNIIPRPTAPPALYRLTAVSDFPAGAQLAPTQLQVEVPTAEAALDTTRIALSRSATTLDYFADASWTDRLPLVIEARLLESFQNAHRLVALAGAASAARSDAMLALELRHFEAQYAGSALPHWRIELSADLISSADRKVLASRTFSGGADAAQNNMAAIVESADEAWHGVAVQIVDWAADTLARRPR
jgi:cholesterol transport system auxiliary component